MSYYHLDKSLIYIYSYILPCEIYVHSHLEIPRKGTSINNFFSETSYLYPCDTKNLLRDARWF